MPTCPNCGNQAAENAVFCDQCGTRLPALAPSPSPDLGQPEEAHAPWAIEAVGGGVPEGVLICPDCGAENVPGELFCDVCGNPLEAPAPVAVEAVAETVAEPVVEPVAEEVTVEAIIEEVAAAQPVAAPAASSILEEAAQDVYCHTCGAPIQPGEAFCGNCGARVSASPVQVEIAPIEPILEEAAAVQPIEEVVVEQAPIEEWLPEEILIEEIVVEEVAVEELPIEVVAEPVEFAPLPEAAPLPEVAPLPEFELAVPVATGPYLEIVDSGAHIPLVEQSVNLMGRVDEVSSIYPDVDLTPHGGEEGGVSRRHAELHNEGGAWFVVDLDSTNGTFINGAELRSKIRVPLNDGDRLSLGELQIVFHA